MRLDNWFITNPDTSQQKVLKVPINQNLIVKGVTGSGKTNTNIIFDSDNTELFSYIDNYLFNNYINHKQ